MKPCNRSMPVHDIMSLSFIHEKGEIADSIYKRKHQIECNQVAGKHAIETAATSCRIRIQNLVQSILFFQVSSVCVQVDGCDFLQCLKIRHLAIRLTKGTRTRSSDSCTDCDKTANKAVVRHGSKGTPNDSDGEETLKSNM